MNIVSSSTWFCPHLPSTCITQGVEAMWRTRAWLRGKTSPKSRRHLQTWASKLVAVTKVKSPQKIRACSFFFSFSFYFAEWRIACAIEEVRHWRAGVPALTATITWDQTRSPCGGASMPISGKRKHFVRTIGHSQSAGEKKKPVASVCVWQGVLLFTLIPVPRAPVMWEQVLV